MYTLFKEGHKEGTFESMGDISDGSHTFDELYDHRCLLFLVCMDSHPDESWFSKLHDDGSKLDGWFICGMELPSGMITYHLPDRMWDMAVGTGAEELNKGIHWDGHTPEDVINRLTDYLKEY